MTMISVLFLGRSIAGEIKTIRQMGKMSRGKTLAQSGDLPDDLSPLIKQDKLDLGAYYDSLLQRRLPGKTERAVKQLTSEE